MYTFSVTVDIDAAPSRTWRALRDPAEVVQWDSGVVEALDAPADYPSAGQHVRWRYRGGPFRVLHDRPLEVVPERTLRAELSLGPFRFHETYRLEPRDKGSRLTASMALWALLPLVGWLVERLYVGPQTERAVRASMDALKAHCEASL